MEKKLEVISQDEGLYARELALVDRARTNWESGEPDLVRESLGTLLGAYEELLGETMKFQHIADLQFDRLVRTQQELQEANATLERISGYDKLTGLYNRRKMIEVLDHEIQRIERFGAPGTIVMADIDRFKPINDTYGHLVGDEVLVQVSSLLKDKIRKVDFCFRWGGEEFVILLTETGYEEAMATTEKLRQEIEAYPCFTPGPMTVSFGVAAYHEGWNQDTWIYQSDLALYQAKHLGRNRVEGRP